VFLLVGVVGLVRALFRRHTRAAAVFAACVVVLIIAGLMSPGALATRTAYSAAIGRYLAPVLAALALFAAHLGGRRTLPLWVVTAAVQLALAVPYSWSVADLHAVAEILLSLIPVLAALAVISVWPSLRQHPRLALALSVASLAAFALPWHAARERHRYRIYEAAAANASATSRATPSGHTSTASIRSASPLPPAGTASAPTGIATRSSGADCKTRSSTSRPRTTGRLSTTGAPAGFGTRRACARGSHACWRPTWALS
jgi:4-amino-4-deoxy-L-arabinose transferase-like glycosyltransferase